MFRFSVAQRAYVTLNNYSLVTEHIATVVSEALAPGNYHIEWSAGNLSAGVYFYELRSGKSIQMRKMIVID